MQSRIAHPYRVLRFNYPLKSIRIILTWLMLSHTHTARKFFRLKCSSVEKSMVKNAVCKLIIASSIAASLLLIIALKPNSHSDTTEPPPPPPILSWLAFSRLHPQRRFIQSDENNKLFSNWSIRKLKIQLEHFHWKNANLQQSEVIWYSIQILHIPNLKLQKAAFETWKIKTLYLKCVHCVAMGYGP